MIDVRKQLKQRRLAEEKELPKGSSLSAIAWAQFRKHPLARLSLFVLGFLYLVAAFADFLAPYPERYLDANATFQPPNRIRFRDKGGFVGPFIYGMKKEVDLETFETIWQEDTSQKYPIKLLVQRNKPRDLYVPFPVNLIPEFIRQPLGIKAWVSPHLFGVEDPNDRVNLYLWGSDDLGATSLAKSFSVGASA
jgi:peptide/nickel transport system permease protein